MHVHIARQPIFDARKHIFAYELLFRKVFGLSLGELGGDRATTNLLSSTFLTEGIERITGSKPCFINFTENLLLNDLAGSFPKNKIVIEILENVSPSIEVVDACRKLSRMGYRLALDDFIFHNDLLPLVELADIIKLDYQASSPEEIECMLAELAPYPVQYLAEKVETYAEFAHAKSLGFHYFQGYFFARPEAIRIREVAVGKANQLYLLSELAGPELDLARLERIIETDVALSFKLLRYINSAYFSLVRTVNSIRQAILYLGEQELRRFVILAVISDLAEDKPAELTRLSLIRAHFCEHLGINCGYREERLALFSLGLFSLIDAIFDMPMEVLLTKLPLAGEIKEALLQHQGHFAHLLQLVIAYEQGRDEDCQELLEQLSMNPNKLWDLYQEAIRFATLVS